METVIPNLHASAPERLPFAPSLEVRAFLLQRSRGNVLIYSVTDLGSEAAEIEQLGGIARRYLSHRHEAMFASGGDARSRSSSTRRSGDRSSAPTTSAPPSPGAISSTTTSR